MTPTDEQVERVARIIYYETRRFGDRGIWEEPKLLSDQYIMSDQEKRPFVEAARAIAALPPQGDGLAELRVGNFVMRTSPNGIWIGRTGGEGGEFAAEHVERVIAQFYREQF